MVKVIRIVNLLFGHFRVKDLIAECDGTNFWLNENLGNEVQVKRSKNK